MNSKRFVQMNQIISLHLRYVLMDLLSTFIELAGKFRCKQPSQQYRHRTAHLILGFSLELWSVFCQTNTRYALKRFYKKMHRASAFEWYFWRQIHNGRLLEFFILHSPQSTFHSALNWKQKKNRPIKRMNHQFGYCFMQSQERTSFYSLNSFEHHQNNTKSVQLVVGVGVFSNEIWKLLNKKQRSNRRYFELMYRKWIHSILK